jgi:hypothetical protein
MESRKMEVLERMGVIIRGAMRRRRGCCKV